MNNSNLTLQVASIESTRNLLGLPLLTKEEKERVEARRAEKARIAAEEADKSPEQLEREGWDL